ncbi:MAG: GLPGLI family protein [Sediminibacterium sp.]
MKSIKKVFVVITALCIQNRAASQVRFSDTALYKVTYKFIFSYDTADPRKKIVENMNLYLSQSCSVFRDSDYEMFQKERSRLREQFKAMAKLGNESKTISANRNVKRVPLTEVFKKSMDNKIYKKEVLVGRDYLIEDNLPQIDWKIQSDTKMFGELKGQKAEGYFRGRHYTAWFVTQLPISSGPWKLSGLPGIIFEASDDKQEVVFQFAGFELLKKQDATLINLPSAYIKVNQAEYDRLQKLAAEDLVGFVSNMHGQQGITVSLDGKNLETFYNNKPRPNPAKSSINNPIEKVKQ